MEYNNPYNKYRDLPQIAYRIIEHLMLDDNANIIWKLLKYNDPNAYSKDDLTQEEKAALIYDGIGHENDYNVFLDYMMDDAVKEEKTFLRIYPSYTTPRTRTTGIQDITIEVYVHSKINHLTNYSTRTDMIIQALLEVLNGCDIGGLGCMFFDNSISGYDRIQIIGQKPYKGKMLIMSVNLG